MGKNYARILREKVNTFRSTLRPFLRSLLPISPSISISKLSPCHRYPIARQGRFILCSFTLRKMREVISVHVGQAGVQIGNACCKFFLFKSPIKMNPYLRTGLKMTRFSRTPTMATVVACSANSPI